MKIVKPDAVDTVEEAQELITTLQLRLLDCERFLDDLARSAEIATMTGQLHLLGSFVQTAQDYLQDRLELESTDVTADSTNVEVISA
jgi:uncharacterized protein YerC